MRSLFHFRWLLTVVLGLGSLLAAHATHTKGGDITYSSIASTTAGVPRYHVVVQLYLDPTSPAKQETIQFVATQGTCGATAANSTVQILPKQQVLTVEGLNTYQIARYSTDIDLPAGQWTLSATLENRVGGIVNSINSINTNIYLSAFLDNTFPLQDASPKFGSILLPLFTGNAIPTYSFSTFDADGDSLRYEFVPPQQKLGGEQVVGNCGSDLLGYQPAPHFRLNVATGALTPGTPTGTQGYYVMAVRVSEYRRLAGQWVIIGYVTRDIIYLTSSSANQAPTFTNLSLNGGAAQSPSQPLAVRPGQTLRLTLTAADADASQQLRFTSDAPNVVPGLSLTTLSGTQAQLTWQVPATLPPGRYSVPVAVLDNGSPYNASQEQTLVFVVSNQALAARPDRSAASEAYPVPFREQVQFRAAPGQAITLVDALGRAVAHLTADPDGRVRWQPAPTLPSGLYLARSADGQLLARLLRE